MFANLIAELVHISQPHASYFLRKMENVGILSCIADGPYRLYSINPTKVKELSSYLTELIKENKDET